MSDVVKRIGDIVRDLAWIRSLSVPEIVEYDIVVHKPDRIVIDPASGGRVRRFPLLEARVVDVSGYSERLAEIRVLESLDASGRALYGKIMMCRRGRMTEVPIVLSYGCDVRVDARTLPLNVYLYLLAIADALRLPYATWHRAYALVAKPDARKSLFLVLLLNILHELIKLVVELYEAIRTLAEKSVDVESIQSLVRSTVASVLDSLLFTRHGISDINNIVRQYIPLPDDFVLYAPTCEICGRRIEGMLLPGDLKSPIDDFSTVTLDMVRYTSNILDALKTCNVPLLCRSCRMKLREKLSRLYEAYGNKVGFDQLLKIALDEVRREVRTR